MAAYLRIGVEDFTVGKQWWLGWGGKAKLQVNLPGQGYSHETGIGFCRNFEGVMRLAAQLPNI